jgi:hypothetical protein
MRDEGAGSFEIVGEGRDRTGIDVETGGKQVPGKT